MRILATLIALTLWGPAWAAPPALQDGDLLGRDNWEAAQGLLPDDILTHYKRGEYGNRILALDRPGQRRLENPPDFRQASDANRGRYALTPAGTIIERASGTQPAFVTGLPFPDIDPADAQAGTKIVWNYFYAMWYRGDYHFLTELVMLGRGGVERRIVTDVRQRMYDGAPEARTRPNPDNLFLQNMARVTGPADLAGTLSLTWRSRQPDRQDSYWTYVPGLRRPRQVSPLNRSDGFLGSDISIDDGPFFDGKMENFTFRLVGRQDQLVLVDPYTIRGEVEMIPVTAGGGWRTVWKPVPRIGADDPGWKGLPWAPVSAVLARRPVWVVEAVAKDPKYLFGRLVLRFDTETYFGSWASKYDRAGSLLISYQVSMGPYSSPDGRTWIAAGGIAVQTAESPVYQRATAILFPPRNPDNPADWRVQSAPDQFDLDELVKQGR
jgi:hypothetical protein